MDKPTQSEANPICASSIRLHLHLAQVQVFVVFHSWTVFPTDTPAETQNPPRRCTELVEVDKPTQSEGTQY